MSLKFLKLIKDKFTFMVMILLAGQRGALPARCQIVGAASRIALSVAQILPTSGSFVEDDRASTMVLMASWLQSSVVWAYMLGGRDMPAEVSVCAPCETDDAVEQGARPPRTRSYRKREHWQSPRV